MSPLSVELSSSEFSKENLKNCSFVIEGFRKFRKNLNSSIILFRAETVMPVNRLCDRFAESGG